MYGIFMESYVIFKLYGGSGWLLALYLIFAAVLFFMEKDKGIRAVFLWFPLATLFLFFFPLFRKVYVRFMGAGDTEYRMLWLMPMKMTVAYVGCKLTTILSLRGKALWPKRLFSRVFVPCVVVLCMVLGGSLVYKNQYMSRAENAYHIPQESIDVARLITSDAPSKQRVRAAVPGDLVHFLRQYDTDIILAYGRDIVAYGYYHEVHEAIEKGDHIVMKELADALDEAEVAVLVLRMDRPIDEEPGTYGWNEYARTANYILYRRR